MKHILLGLILSIPFIVSAQHADTMIVNSDSAMFAKVEVESSYPGGQAAWRRYLLTNMHYPNKAVRKRVQGTVIVQFIIAKEGNVNSVEAIEGPEMLREEGVRLIKSSGKWIPAQQNGKPVKSYKKQPFNFRLNV